VGDIELPDKKLGSFQAEVWAQKWKERIAWLWQCHEMEDILTPN
jgi:hypothetical protein